MTKPLHRPELKAILAMASNRVIGKDGGLPWRLPADLRWFKKLTLGHPVVMGRRTMKSLPGPLPGRRNLVVTSALSLPEGFERAGSIGEALGLLADEPTAFVIGGAGLFAEMLPLCGEVYLSWVFEAHEGDVIMPPFEEDFSLEEVLHRDEDFELRRYRRKQG